MPGGESSTALERTLHNLFNTRSQWAWRRETQFSRPNRFKRLGYPEREGGEVPSVFGDEGKTEPWYDRLGRPRLAGRTSQFRNKTWQISDLGPPSSSPFAASGT